MIRIIADNKIPFLKGALEDVADISYYPGSEITGNKILNADALIIRTRTRCDESLLKGSRVKMIATATIGFDHIDTEYCKSRNINWTNAPGCNSSSVEQYVTSALLELAVNHGYNFEGKTIGIVGAGNVGTKVARIARLLGMEVLLNDPPRARKEGGDGFVSLEELKSRSDIISFHVPLLTEGVDRTLWMADRDFFNSIKQSIILINTSRGEVVQGKALKEAINSDKVKYSVIDVWENEPLPDPDLIQLVSIATPHIAGYSTDGKVNGTTMSVHAISRFFGLGKEDWKPVDVPGPENHSLVVDCTGLKKEEILLEVYSKIYDINTDDRDLRNDPGKFEELRGNYRLRREAPYYSVRLNNNPFEELAEILEGLGFSVLELDCFC